jgi:PKD repeat protein
MRNRYRLAATGLVLALACVVAPSASALVVHDHRGHFLGIQLHRGINPAAVPGSIAASQTTPARSRDNGILTYHGGPVVHSSAPYLIFWTPSGESIPASSESLMERYFTDVAADSGESDDVFGVSRQYTDATGFAGSGQTFDSATQALIDTQPYPAADTANCSGSPCITDAQLEQELQRLVAADGLPNDGPAGSTELPQSAPIYLIVLPGDVNVCDPGVGCASATFCAYHSSFTDGNGDTLLYAAMPMLLADSNPKRCQVDGNTAVQEPNSDPADVVIGDVAHEDNETITDPLGTSWWDPISGNEEADGCSMTGPFSSKSETDPNAFEPTLGGSASTDNLYDQLINGDQYYTQSLWSNGDGTSSGSGCQMQPAAGTITPSFSVSGATQTGSSLSFNPSASTSTFAISSETWDFGDGTTAFHAGGLTSVSHAYTAPGTYAVTLTLVDNRGNLQTTTQKTTITGPAASFTYSPTSPLEGTSVSFDGSSSIPDAGAQITSYVWDFGDGSAPYSSGSTPSVSHTYATDGTYTVTLTVTDSDGLSSTASQQITVVDENPTASFTISAAPYAVGQPVSFTGSGLDPDGTITSYSWNFGDGSSATGATATASHAYTSSGTYTVSLTVTDSDDRTDTVSQQITVYSLPKASFGHSPPAPVTGTPVSFNGSGSSDADPGVGISSYAWNFGDGTAGSGATPSHTYSNPGNYTVSLTVTNSVGLTATGSEEVTIFPPSPAASFVVATAHPAADVPVQFNGSSSSAPQESITSYVWNFGDGSTASGSAAAHTYSKPGTYRVSLTIVSSYGLSATADDAVVVVSGGRIEKISVSRRRGFDLLSITLTGPGRLSVGKRHFVVARGETIKVRVAPTAAQRRQLQGTHRMTVTMLVAFTPQIGRPTNSRVSVRFVR